MLYNVIYTGAIPILTGIFEQKLPSPDLASNPHLYETSSKNQSYTLRNLFLTFLDACKWLILFSYIIVTLVYQSGIQFLFLYYSYQNSTGILMPSGNPDSTISLLVFGQLQTIILLIRFLYWVLDKFKNLFSQYISYAFLLNHFTWLSAATFGISFIGFIVIDLIYNALTNVCPYLEYWSMQSMAYQPLVYLNSKFAF